MFALEPRGGWWTLCCSLQHVRARLAKASLEDDCRSSPNGRLAASVGMTKALGNLVWVEP